MISPLDHDKTLYALREIGFSGELYLFRRIGSTQDIAMRLLEAGAPDGTLVLAEEQTIGRGRHGRKWHAPHGTAILLSVLLRPDSLKGAKQVIMLGAVCVAHTLLRWFAKTDLALKWPNDVLLCGRKVAGVLAEAVYSGNTLKGVALGIGVNVDNDFSDRPDLLTIATSVNSESDTYIDRLDLLVGLVRQIEKWRPRLSDKALANEWREMLTTIGRKVLAEKRNREIIKGIAIDVDSDGALLVRRENTGETIRLIAGDVTLSRYE